MSTEVAIIPPQPLTLQQRAVTAIGDRDETQLKKLADGTKDITAITNDDGYKQIHAARIVLKNERIAIEKDCKKAREDATAFGKAVIAEEARLVAIISPEEKRLQKLQDGWEAAIEAERQAKIDAEIERVTDLQQRVVELRGCQTLSPSDGSKLIAEHIQDLERIFVDDSFQEFEQLAIEAKAAGVARLEALHIAAVAHEAEQARISAEREELARLRAAQALLDAEAKATRDAEAAKQAAELKKERDEHEATAKAERQRIADENEAAQKIRDAEAAKLATERAELARQQEDLRKAQEPPKPAVTKRGVAVKPPSASELIDVLAKHYKAHPDTIIDWLQHAGFAQVQAA